MTPKQRRQKQQRINELRNLRREYTEKIENPYAAIQVKKFYQNKLAEVEDELFTLTGKLPTQ